MPSPQTHGRALTSRRTRTCRSGCTCTSRSAGSAATSVTSGSTPTRTRDEIEKYLDAGARMGALRAKPAVAGRSSTSSTSAAARRRSCRRKQLQRLIDRLNATVPWDAGRGNHLRVRAGHAHRSEARSHPRDSASRASASASRTSTTTSSRSTAARIARAEIDRAYDSARELGFPQINIDLIAGMVDETEDELEALHREGARAGPDSVTIYQMELPYNTTISGDDEGRRQVRGRRSPTGRPSAAGCRRPSPRSKRRLQRQQRLHGGEGPGEDQVRLSRSASGKAPTCSASASRRSATSTACTSRTSIPGRSTRRRSNSGDIPLGRAYRPTDEERLIREFVLQLKRGSMRPAYFAGKYGVDVLSRFAGPTQLDPRRRLPGRCAAPIGSH